jgi:hypothetical protein
MMCPECKTTLKRDDKKWMYVIIDLEERSFALYYCPNPQCSRWELPVLRNLETDSPHKGPIVENNIDCIESVYA